jgi:predicted amidohydrolase YtcJ
MRHIAFLLAVLTAVLLSACQDRPAGAASGGPDLILHNARVYPVTSALIEDGAVVIDSGRIVAVGPSADILAQYGGEGIPRQDCGGAFLMPGFIEGHGHFSGLGYNIIQLDLLDASSWQAIVDSVARRAKTAKPGEWIIGRGWHQEKWTSSPGETVNGYPYHALLSEVSPDNPVLLSHASGHAVFANAAAMAAAGVTPETPDPPGGRIVRDNRGQALGVFEERAEDLIGAAYSEYEKTLDAAARLAEWHRAIRAAQDHCLSYGITSFQDAGSSFDEIDRYTQLAKDDSLDLRLWVMVRHPYAQLKDNMDGLPVIGVGKDMFTCRAIKSEVDGALGSFGAWLLKPYADKPGFTGQNTTSIYDVKGIADIAMEKDMQMCVHAIGDRANRVVLDIYEGVMAAQPDKQDLRWRIEHAQHLDPTDMPRFKANGIIASMQGVHCTSDAPFVVKRLGEDRARLGAYAWRSLLDLGVIVANGTDAPVERVDPIPSFYASVTRRRPDSGLVFFKEQAMTRAEAIYSYTLGNAYAAFEDDVKGSLEPGKWADMVLLSQDLLTCPDDSILATNVLMTMVGGEIKYAR